MLRHLYYNPAAVEILCVKNPNVSVFSDRVEPLFMPSKNMLLTNKSRKKNTKNGYSKTPLVFCKNINAKIHKNFKE